MYFFSQGLYDQALEDCEKALRYNDGNYKALYRKAKSLKEMGRHQEAYEAVAKCSLVVPQVTYISLLPMPPRLLAGTTHTSTGDMLLLDYYYSLTAGLEDEVCIKDYDNAVDLPLVSHVCVAEIHMRQRSSTSGRQSSMTACCVELVLQPTSSLVIWQECLTRLRLYPLEVQRFSVVAVTPCKSLFYRNRMKQYINEYAGERNWLIVTFSAEVSKLRSPAQHCLIMRRLAHNVMTLIC